MADTSLQEEVPQTNGFDGLTEEEKSKMRPADIDAVSIFFFSFQTIFVFENNERGCIKISRLKFVKLRERTFIYYFSLN